MKPNIVPPGMTEPMYEKHLIDRLDDLQEELMQASRAQDNLPEWQLGAHEEYIDSLIYEIEHVEREIAILRSKP